ncbi:MAG: hypothetical protein EBW52_08940 [Betaproteobacteria bacterium]|nr:hypothetical protein [Betaproteobacteria bacterium]
MSLSVRSSKHAKHQVYRQRALRWQTASMPTSCAVGLLSGAMGDGLGVWLAARRLNRGRFVWTRSAESTVQMNTSQLGALAMGLPWQRLGDAGIIAVI